jgi:hypothetical protein
MLVSIFDRMSKLKFRIICLSVKRSCGACISSGGRLTTSTNGRTIIVGIKSMDDN